MNPALELTHVNYSIDGQMLLSDINWAIDHGQRWVILGPNGAGKTTLLKLLCGYLWPDPGGLVRRRGETLTDLRVLRRSIGWVTATLANEIPPRETVLDVVLSGLLAQTRYAPTPWDKPAPSDRHHAEDLLADLGCDHLSTRMFSTLSQGEKQKALIARARMAKPFMIILDEPCAGLDPGARERFLTSIENLLNQFPTLGMVYVTHHIEEIMPAFSHTLVIKNGSIVHSGPTSDVITSSALSNLYDIPLSVDYTHGRYGQRHTPQVP